MTAPTLRLISIAEAFPLRQKRLNPALTLEEAEQQGRNRPGSFQCGAFCHGTLVSVVTFHPEAVPVHADGTTPPPFATPWRLRAMATAEGYEGLGYGRQVVLFGLSFLTDPDRKGTLPTPDAVWLYGRNSAAGFYAALGFTACGIHYETPQTGPHDLFWSRLPSRRQDGAQ